ncbi:hypothetical protein AX16_004821 [Volvariella volvacea WC 439]|nr:hypothetical protein AX16_004821 [Volvariella volvacea WC 439]
MTPLRIVSAASFENCPADVVTIVAFYTEIKTLLDLRLVSRALHDLISPIVLRAIKTPFPWTFSNWHEGKPETATTEKDDRLLDFGFSNLYAYSQVLTVRVGPFYEVDMKSLPTLLGTMSKLRSLRSLNIQWYMWEGDENVPVTSTVLDILGRIISSVLRASGGVLEDLSLYPHGQGTIYGQHSFPSELLQVRGLKKLRFVYDNQGWDCDSRRRGQNHRDRIEANSQLQGVDPDPSCLPPLSKERVREIIANNPDIQELTVIQGCAMNYVQPADLLLDNLKLEYLDVQGVCFPLSSLSSPQNAFRKLTHLKVGTPMSDISLDNLWAILLHAGIKTLTTLETSQVSSSFISFLSSFSGLTRLSLNRLELDNETPMSELAQDFFTKGLYPHSDTLRYLSIDFESNVDSVTGWFFTPSWTPYLSRLTVLEALGVHTRQATNDFDLVEEDGVSRHQEVLDGVAKAFGRAENSRLRSLKIHYPQKTYGCEMSHVRWLWSVQEFLHESVVNKLKVSDVMPETLILESGTYSAVKGEHALRTYERVSEYIVLE